VSTSLEARFRASVAAPETPAGAPWVVAVSGGLDSVVLLHLLRFVARVEHRLVVAHFDHAMRAGSADDARWVTGLAAAWGLEARVARAPSPLGSEEHAREARHAYLDAVRREVGGALALTAHHADDQAETVLFRALRGSGRAGLAGIAARRGHFFRPLLSFWREELEAYARDARLAWRQDASNADLGYARNALRHRVLPDVERLVSPGARRALVRLADIAREEEAGWESLVPGLLAPLGVELRAGGLWADAGRLSALHPAVRGRVLRALAARMGGALDEAATRRGVEFLAAARSGASVDLGGGLTLQRELDRVRIGARAEGPADRPLAIPDAGPGRGWARLAGRDVPVAWGEAGRVSGHETAAFDPERLRFPLTVRGREPGDRIRTPGGTKKVKKLLLERRIPRPDRGRVALVVDAEGDVLWIPGVARAAHGSPEPGALVIGVG
jgi:tRNA(Ile)-lysidine synthase